jgi:hypothetical protein
MPQPGSLMPPQLHASSQPQAGSIMQLSHPEHPAEHWGAKLRSVVETGPGSHPQRYPHNVLNPAKTGRHLPQLWPLKFPQESQGSTQSAG